MHVMFTLSLGTIFSGMICLCFGIPRFSQRDGAKQRIGAFVIDLVVGVAQAFCLLFCLVGYGWSVWWGVIMLKVARECHVFPYGFFVTSNNLLIFRET